MKKNNSKTMKKNAAALAELNYLYNELNERSKALSKRARTVRRGTKAERIWLEDFEMGTRSLSERFERLRSSMPRVKFDMGRGEYFYAEEGGQETFAVRVSRTYFFDIRVSARSSGEAVDKAKMQIARENGIPINCLIAADYSR